MSYQLGAALVGELCISIMAKTKQTAAKSTGGKPPRKALAAKAARKGPLTVPRLIPASQVAFVDGLYQVRRPNGKNEDIPMSSKDLIGEEVRYWCELHPGAILTPGKYHRWNLDEWESPDDINGTDSDSDTDSYVFNPTPSDHITPYSVKLVGEKLDSYQADTLDLKGKYVPVVFCSLFSKEGRKEQARMLDEVDAWCVGHPGQPYILSTIGARSPVNEPLPDALRTEVPVVYRSARSGCGPCSVANLIRSRDAGQARLIGLAADQLRIRSLRKLSDWISKNSAWKLQRKCEIGTLSSRKDFLLGQHRGLFVVVSVDQDGGEFHVVGVDARAGLIYDSMERYAMLLCSEGLDRCLGAGHTCVGIREIRELFRNQSSKKKRKLLKN